ncbi:transcriptional regulator NrdR [Chitinivibrio alkaliphilus ACht1]|uniref:Transcriptional repressor NrdR n=1 Tax=Chitinivibrio alkaliphilus ACht1 TaxID=1313304 RepID=U7D6R1_9BACT|nr:transcriptional regulator NrdR [Chitinivibrio alkaliphilus ACht1]
MIDSRTAHNGSAIRRRRECTVCEGRFTTYEYIEETQIAVIKRDLRRENYNRQKLVEGMQIACKKRPVSINTIAAMANAIEKELRSLGKTEVASLTIGEMVMTRLYEVDQIAYIRFASVYLDVNSAEEFITQTGILQRK